MNSRLFTGLAWTALFAYGGLFVYVAGQHIAYPGFLETTEGDALRQIQRAAEGQALYPAPTDDYLPISYLPLYYLASAPLYLFFGDSFVGPRLLSVLCALFAGALIGRITWKESGSVTIAALAGAFYFASYRIMDAYLTCVLPDAMLLFWVLLGYWFLAYGTNKLHDIAWLVCFTLAFWTKQHGALFFGCAVLYALIFRKNYLPWWVIVAALLLGGPVAYLTLGPLLGERFFYYTFAMPRRWEQSLWFAVRRTGFVLACFVPFASLLTLVWLRTAVVPLTPTPLPPGARGQSDWRMPPLAWFAVTLLLATAFTMTAAGSSNNHYIPFLAFSTITAALGVQVLAEAGEPRGFFLWLTATVIVAIGVTLAAERLFRNHPIPTFVPYVAGTVFVGYLVLRLGQLTILTRNVALAGLLALGQLATSFYEVPRFVPQPGFEAATGDLRDELAKLNGPVIWIPYGNVPADLLGRKLAVAPSSVVLEDITRQVNADHQVSKDLAAFRHRIHSTPNLYLLSNSRIEVDPAWSGYAKHFVLESDFGNRFAAVQQITYHWYSGGEYPRYLYRYSPPTTRGDGLQ